MLVYVASPYSSPDPAIREQRYRAVEAFCARKLTDGTLKAGTVLFSPIVYCHNMAVRHKMPTDAAWWNAFNDTMMGLSTEFWVLRLLGWEESLGVTDERHKWLKKNGIIQYFDDDEQGLCRITGTAATTHTG